jgi:hypothetical protein
MPLLQQDRELIIEFAKEIGIETSEGWENFTKNITNKNAIVLRFKNRYQVSKIHEFISNLNQRNNIPPIIIRTAAGGKNEEYSKSFSITNCVGEDTDVIGHLLGDENSEFHEITLIDEKNKIVRIGANVQVGTADKVMYENKAINASLPTSSLIPYPTVTGGLLANGGHGTGKDQPAVAGLIEAITICGPDGVIRRIDRNHPKFGGKKFDTMIGANLGLFGTVLNAEVKCRPAAKVRSALLKMNIFELEQQVNSGIFDAYPYVSVMYMPTYRIDEIEKTCSANVEVVIWEPIDTVELLVETKNENFNYHPTLKKFTQEALIRLNDGINIPHLLSTHPHLIPYMMKIIADIEIGKSNSKSIGPWGSQVHYQTAYPCPNKPSTLDDVDCLFPTTGKACPEIVTALKETSKKLQEYAKKGLYPVIDAIYLRYFKGFKGGLSTSSFEQGDHVCAFDIVSSANVPGWNDFKMEMMQFFIDKLNAKLHLGKTVLVDGKFPVDNYMQRAYGESYREFIDILQEYYAECKIPVESSPYLNTFNKTLVAEGLGLKLQPQPSQPQSEAVTRQMMQHSYEIAEKLLSRIDDNLSGHVEDFHVHMLKKHLNVIVNQRKPRMAKNKNVTFSLPAEDKLVDKQEAQCKVEKDEKPVTKCMGLSCSIQ